MAFVAQSNTRAAPQPNFGFGFLATPPASMSVGWSSSSLAQSTAVTQNAPNPSTSRVQKRRHENEDESSRDESMEPPQRTIIKRPRLYNPDSKPNKDRKPTSDASDVDVGLLLASLPSQSLLPILNSLLVAHPGLKSAILPLIPRPALPAALKAILQSAEGLRDSYPYSQSASTSLFALTPSRTGMFDAPSPSFGSQGAFSGNTGMSDSYIASRIRPHVDAFVAVCMSYWPYFSFLAPSQFSASNATAHAAALQAFHKDECHPGDVFTLLAAISTHFLSQPALTQSALGPALLPRLSQEWTGWVTKLDQMVNAEARMFGSEAVNAWANQFDDLASRAQGELATIIRSSRERWLQQVGWLIGRGTREARWG